MAEDMLRSNRDATPEELSNPVFWTEYAKAMLANNETPTPQQLDGNAFFTKAWKNESRKAIAKAAFDEEQRRVKEAKEAAKAKANDLVSIGKEPSPEDMSNPVFCAEYAKAMVANNERPSPQQTAAQ